MADAPPPPPKPPAPPRQAGNPLHGLTLERIVEALAAHYGWAELGRRLPLRCFTSEPSVKSSLTFLRRTPWAREKVEGLYLFMLREARRASTGQKALAAAPPRPRAAGFPSVKKQGAGPDPVNSSSILGADDSRLPGQSPWPKKK